MSEPTVQTASEPVILTEKKGYIGYIILNRPQLAGLPGDDPRD